jgi:hypothetical protein
LFPPSDMLEQWWFFFFFSVFVFVCCRTWYFIYFILFLTDCVGEKIRYLQWRNWGGNLTVHLLKNKKVFLLPFPGVFCNFASSSVFECLFLLNS